MFSNSFTSLSDNPENILSRSLAVKRRDETSPIPQTGTYLCTRLQSIGASLERLYQLETLVLCEKGEQRRNTMTHIVQGNQIATLINVFTVAPERQQALVTLLVEATEAVMKKQPGFISANIHKSLDGTHVTNYAQWRSRADFETMLANPQAQLHMQAATQFATYEPYLYEVAFVEEASSEGEPSKIMEREDERA